MNKIIFDPAAHISTLKLYRLDVEESNCIQM